MATPRLAELLGQPEVSEYLRQIVASGRYANAYLFHGPAGVGKGTAALSFARAALCDRTPGAAPAPAPAPAEPSLFGGEAAEPAAAKPGGTADDACGACPACLKSGSLQHPDLLFLFPVSGEEKELDTVVGDTLAAMRDDPLYTFQYEKAASIRVSLTRELQRTLAYRPYEASRRVVVLRDCDRMREDQYSMLLKAVEEPGATTIWILTTSRLARVPATIRSRCQRVRLSPLPEAVVEGFLRERAGVQAQEAAMLAALSNGGLARALALRGTGARELRDEALRLLEPAQRGDARETWKAAQGATKFGRAGRETLRRTLEFQQLWLRDVLRASHGAPRERLVNRDREKELLAWAPRIDAAEVRRRLLVLEEALRALDGNVTADLTLFSALSRVAGQRLGENAWPAHGAGRRTI